MKPTYVFILSVVALLLLRCGETDPTNFTADAASVLEATRTKMLTTPTHHYRYRSFWDNRFASSTYEDSMRVTYSYLPASKWGFGFHAAGDIAEMLYDGEDKLSINHTERKVIRTPASEIGSSHFKYTMVFLADPKALPEFEALTYFADTIVAGKRTYLYSVTEYSPSVQDTTKEVVSTREHYVDPELKLVDRIRTISHVERDTSQTIDYYFTDYVFEDEPYGFGDSDRGKSLGYREISEADEDEERLAGLVKVGEQLHRSDYNDMTGEEKHLYGKTGRKTLVMFSFIGCGGCEYALREMKKKDFAVRDGIELMYSSPVDKSSALPKYFKKKAFPFIGFGKESLMNANFKVAAFPTFVLINETGGVDAVLGGYDEEVAEILFE